MIIKEEFTTFYRWKGGSRPLQLPQPAGSRPRLSQQRGTHGDGNIVIIKVKVQTKSDQTTTVNKIIRNLHNVHLQRFLKS